MGKKLVYVDIGTHIGQEYLALTSYSAFEFLYRFIKIYTVKLIYRERKIFTPRLKEAINIIRTSREIKKNKENLYTILVEPNYRLYDSRAYKTADKVFCLALGEDNDEVSLQNLFFPNSFKESQGASIYKEKAGIDKIDTDLVLVLGCSKFAKLVKSSLDNLFDRDGYELVIRVNCEGSEDSVIYAFKKEFGPSFKTVFGSLKDVLEIKGEQKMIDLESFIAGHDMKFFPFTPLYTTWNKALIKLSELLK